MGKSKAGYERLFEDLMQYTDYRDVDDIQGETKQETQTNIRDFFKQVKDDADAKGREFPLSRRLVFEMSEAFGRLSFRKVKPRERMTRKEQVIKGTAWKSYARAKEEHLTTINSKGKEVYKGGVVIKGKFIEIYRDSKGKFARKPK